MCPISPLLRRSQAVGPSGLRGAPGSLGAPLRIGLRPRLDGAPTARFPLASLGPRAVSGSPPGQAV